MVLAADVRFLIEALRRTSRENEVVLVGGQALELWAMYYKVAPPDTGAPYLTQDADLFGTAADAYALSHVLGGTIRKSTLDDNTPNSATITFTGPSGAKLLVDMSPTNERASASLKRGSLKALRVALVKPVDYLQCSFTGQLLSSATQQTSVASEDGPA